MARHNRKRQVRDKRPSRPPRPLVLIVCEGEVTEPEYFDGLIRSLRNPRVRIEVVGAGGYPKTVVERARDRMKDAKREAKRRQDRNLEFDSVWAVVDFDDHLMVAEARKMAVDNNIEFALSNPNFELRLLLHFRESPGMQHRDKIRTLLREHISDYEKHVDFPRFLDGRAAAEDRSEKLDRAAIDADEPSRNPTTAVYLLTRYLAREPD